MTDTPVQGDKYNWYVSDEGKLFGIEKAVMTKEEDVLLSTLFSPFKKNTSSMNEEQRNWYEYLYMNNNSSLSLLSFNNPCRFIQFQTNEPITDREDFQVAVDALFPYHVVTIWENEYGGTIIESVNGDKNDQVIFEEIVDTLTSDFYVDIDFFIGQTYTLHLQTPEYFNWERNCFQKSLHYLHKQNVYRLYEIIPYLLLEKIEPDSADKLSNAILQDLKHDKEMLQTIKAFIESNLNVSLAAKKLYMHRNSLQYRIDKFIEKTGIDIKHFQGAFTTYLSIINTESFTTENDR